MTLFTEKDDLTLRRQAFRNDYMEKLADANAIGEASITPQEQSPQADRWWPGTVPSIWEKGRWIPAPNCDKVHEYGEEGWRPAANGTHEHWEYPDGS